VSWSSTARASCPTPCARAYTSEENQQRLSTAEGPAAVGRSAACAAHELRNPLSAMKLWLYQLRRSSHDPLVVEQCTIVLEEEAPRLEELAANFLQYSSRPSCACSASLQEIVDGTLRLARYRLEEKRIHLVRERVPNLPEVLADANQLRQVLAEPCSRTPPRATPERRGEDQRGDRDGRRREHHRRSARERLRPRRSQPRFASGCSSRS
jgi:hypothetical protein